MANDVFSGARAKWLPLYEELRSMAMEKLGAFEEHETSSAVLWKHNSTFAEVSAKRDCLVSEPIPYDLIAEITKFRVQEIEAKTKGSVIKNTREKTSTRAKTGRQP